MKAEAAITELAHKGDGVAEIGGDPVFVPRTAPGDVALVNVEDGRGTLVELVTPSPDRVTPPCPHYDRCGGCAIQHLGDDFVAEWKRGLVVQALAQRGIDAEVRGTVTVPARSRRRAVLAARRTGQGVMLGFHGPASHVIENVETCEVMVPAITDRLPALRTLLGHGLTRRGEAKVIVTATDVGLDVAVDLPGRPLDGGLLATLSAEGVAADLARLTWNGEIVAQWRDPAVTFDGIPCVPPPGAFLQAAREAEDVLRGIAGDAVEGAKHVADLFSGCGAFALPLAREAKVDAFDSDKPAIAALEQATRTPRGLKPIAALARDLFRRPLLPDELGRYGAVVIDPPRAGAKAQCEKLAASSVPVIAAVSCNPATFARDARTLIDGGYVMGPVTPVDQFRWSAHVELAAVFHRP